MTASLNAPERVVIWTILSTWLGYLVGALYIVGPALGWILATWVCVAWYVDRPVFGVRPALRRLPTGVTVWLVSMALMLVVLWIGHADYDLGVAKTVKSSVGWAKGWALMALFIFAGAMLPIARRVVIRAQSVLGLQTLLLLPLFLAAPMIGLPEKLYTSPLKIVGGPGPEYFTVYLYTVDPSNGWARWQFFAPWSPFAGLIGVCMAACALEERPLFWKLAGVAGGTAMVALTQSRMALLGLLVCLLAPFALRAARIPFMWLIGALGIAGFAFAAAQARTAAGDMIHAFRSARADSTRVRDTLQRIALDRWEREAPWFGHGTVQPGAHVTEYMPIGSHHTWFGLLFVKGTAGLILLAIPMLWTLVEACIHTLRSPRGRLALAITLALLLFSFGENLEVQVYLLWPYFLLLGIAMREHAEHQAKP